MSFSVRRVEDPTIHVRRNKPDILGIGNVWDNIGNFKNDLDRLEDNIDAADKPVRQKPGKKANSLAGPILKEISSETQHLGKVTRFQLLGENCSYKHLPRSAPSVEIKTRRNDGNKAVPFSDISSINRETYSKSSQALSGVSDRNGYFPSRYTVNGSKSERPSFFMTTTVNPVVINDTSSDLNQNKESSFANTTVNSSLNSQQFSLSTPPSFHGKAVLAKNGAALEKIKERVHKQKTMLSKKDKEISSNTTVDRRLHDCKDKVAISSEKVEKKDTLQVPLTRKVGAISSSGPTYRGFNPVLSHRSKKNQKPKSRQGTNKTNGKGSVKPLAKPEPRVKKVPAKMTRIVSSKCPKEVISTTSWRDGRATVKKILGAKKVKPSSAPVGGSKKADTTYNVTSPTQDDVSEGKLSSDENEDFEIILPQAKKLETNRVVPQLDGIEKASDTNSSNSDAENDEKLRDVLSTEAQSMLAELAEDNSESEHEMKEEKSKKQGGASKKTSRSRKCITTSKPAVDEKYPKEKSRHYDQTEVQKYMAQQLAERKNRLKQEKLQKKKQEEERQRRLNDLYERQKKSFAMPKKEKCVGQTFSRDNGAVCIPGHESYPMEHASGQNESDKENTDVDDVQRSSNGTSLDNYSDGDEVNDIDSHEHLHMQEGGHLNGDVSPVLSAMTVNHPLGQGSVPLDIRAHRLSALQSTALALQSRLQSQAFRLGGVDEESVSRPAARVSREEEETEFKGILPGVANIRKQADENEKQFVKVEAATKIQAAYRAHNVRKSSQWTDSSSHPEHRLSSHPEHSDDDDVIIDDINERHDVAPTVGNVEYPHSPYEVDHSNNGFKLNDLRFERSRVLHADVPVLPSTRFSIPSVPFEPRGDRFSVMNVFSRRHPTVTVEEILNEQPGSETASLLDVEVKTDPKEEYEDDFTDEDISTTSALTEGDLRKESPVVSRPETYSECFESEEEQEESEEKDRTMLDVEDKKSAQHDSSQSPTFNDDVSPKADSVIMPVMTSTMHPEPQHLHHSISLSDDSESVHRPVFITPAPHTSGNRMSPGSLQRKLTAEINRLENVEDSVRQVADIDKTRAVSLAQQETVSLAQFLKAQQQNHEQQMQSLRLKAKDEAIQAAKDLEKTSHAAAMAAAHAKETLAEVQNEALKTNVAHSKRYVEEVSQMATSVLSDTTKQLAEFCKNVTATTSNTVEQLHKIDRPTTTLVERATSISEGHWIQSENESGEHTRTSDVYSNQSKSRDTSLSVTSGLQEDGYSSDEFECDKSQTNTKEESEMKTEPTASVSFSVESIPEDLADKSAADDDTTINEESPNDSQSLSTEKQKRGSPLLDYSSQFEDSSHAPTDDEIDFLLPSIEHKKKSIKLITDDSLDEEKGKGKNTRTPFESDDSFGKFTVEIIQQYMKEEEVRTKHQSAILRLREKSLKEKTKADLQWLEQLKRRSQNKGSDDVMPSIKKRKRGIMMKLEAEKEEIKCLKAANRAASFQRRFMIYQQREITRLHQATLNIREKIQRDVSRKSSQKSLHEPSPAQPKTSSPIRAEANSSMRTSPSNSLSEVKKSSVSANSVSEDISEEQGTSHVSPTATASPFPSYSAPKSERPSQDAESAQPPSERETSSVHRMLRFVGSGEPELSDENLLKIKKMLLKKHQKLVEDESEVNIMLRKVTEMINNQKNNVPTVASHENTPLAESVQTPSTTSDVNDGEEAKIHSELSIPEDLASSGKTISDEIEEDISKKTASKEMKVISEKTPSEYTNCTFESDDTTPSKSSTLAQTSTLNTETHVEDDHSSLTETSDHSDYEEKIKKLKEKIQSEEMKALALEKKKRKMKRSAMIKEVLTLETELKNKKEDNQRKMVEIRTASTLPLPAVTPPISLSSSSIKSNVSQNSAKETPLLSIQKMDHSVSVKEALPVSESQQKKRFEHSDHEIEESLVEILDGPTTSFRGTMSPPLERSEGSDIPEEISEHLESEAHSIASIPEETDIVEEEQNVASNASHISQKSYTEPESSPNIPEDVPDQNPRDSLDKTPEIAEEVLDNNSYTEPQSSSSIPEDLKDSPETTPGVPEEVLDYSYTKLRSSLSIVEQSPGITEDVKESHGKTSSVSVEEYSYTEPRSSTNISDGSPTSHKKLKQSEDLPEAIPEEESDENLDETSVQEELDNQNSDTSENVSEVAEDEDHISEKDNVLAEKSPQDLPNLNDSENLAEESAEGFDGRSQISDISEISEKEQDEDHISEKDNVSAEKVLKDSPNVEHSENRAEMSTEDLDVRSQVSDNSDISENLPEVAEDDISEKSNLSTEKMPEVFPNLKDPELSSKIVPKDSKDVTVVSSHDIDTSEKSTPVVPETSIKIAGKEDISERPSVLVDQEHLETNDAKEDDGKSWSQTSSIAEEITSAYDDEDFSEFGSLKEESEKLIFEDTGRVEKADSGEKQSYEWDESDESAHTSAGNEEIIATGSGTVVPNLPLGDYSEEQDEQEASENSEKLDSIDKNESERSESSKSEKLKAVETEKVEPVSQEEEQEYSEKVEPVSQEEEQEYSEDFEADDDDDETESDIPEILEEEGEELNDENFKTFTADNKVVLAEKDGIEDEHKASDQDEVLDDITDEIYREIMDDSFDCIKTTKNSRRKVEQKLPNEAKEVAKEVAKDKDKSKVVTDDITKDLLADAFLQMMSIKRRKNEKQEDSKLAGKRHHLNTVAKPSGKSPEYETPAVTNHLGLGAGLGAMDEQKVNNALMIAESNQALQKEALKAMNQDIEGLLGTSLDDDEDDFPVNENKYPDNVSDDTEPSVHDYSPMFAVPHNAQEVTSIVNSTIDILTAKKLEGLPLDDCKPTAHILGKETESEFENRSTRSYRNLVFDLTKEVYIDAVSQNEVASQPPWAKAKWKGGQKLSRNFMRWKSDDEVRALVLERVTHTIGLGAPRTTMQTLQRKTPVRGNKKDNVDAILIEELRQEEPQWTDYDEDEAAVKFQVADSILNMLLDDTARVFNAIQAKKKVPDDVVVI